MRFFNYLFFRVAGYYMDGWNDFRGPINGITLVTLLQLSHLWLVLILAALFSEQANYYLFEKRESANFLHSWILFPCLLVYALNMLKYLKFSKYEYFKERWKSETVALKKKRGWFIIFYVLLTIATTVILAIYRK